MGPGQRFAVVGGSTVRAILSERRYEILELVRDAYRQHHSGDTINPDSYFLRFPDKPTARIIALPARLMDGADVAGIKWISSFPENREIALPRASAVIVLNDMTTGFPYACLEGSFISAARTSASAALAAEILHRGKHAGRVAVIGAGPIAASVVDFLLTTGWSLGQVRIHDLIEARAASFCTYLRERECQAESADSAENAINGADLILFATTAAQPFLANPALFVPQQTVLHVSLRDLDVNVILSAQNIVDDIEHCLKAQTSVHLAEQATGSRAFVDGTIGDLISGRLKPDLRRVRIFSPFGLGVLDIAVARFVYREAAASGRAINISDFFASSWPAPLSC
jgi:N-[(2S)-2-amino-2-carboxyethyl]-L-glutamate dehydrogenase